MTNGSQEQGSSDPSADRGESVAGRAAPGTAGPGTPLAQGTLFEAAVHEAADQFAAGCGDVYTDTARNSGFISRCRKGDGVLTILSQPGLAEPARVVLEMTTEEGTRRDWAAYLEEAERNRGAQASLGVVPSTAQVQGGERIRMYGTTRIVVAFDPDHDGPEILRVSLLFLRSQAIAAASRIRTARTRAVGGKLAEAIVLVDQFNTLHNKATIACANVDKVAVELIRLRSRLYRILTQISQDLEEADSVSSAPAPAATADSVTPERVPE